MPHYDLYSFLGKSKENNSLGYQCFLHFSRKRNPRMKKADEVSDPISSLASVSSSVLGEGVDGTARMFFSAGVFS